MPPVPPSTATAASNGRAPVSASVTQAATIPAAVDVGQTVEVTVEVTVAIRLSPTEIETSVVINCHCIR